jgi:hypothetical protein
MYNISLIGIVTSTPSLCNEYILIKNFIYVKKATENASISNVLANARKLERSGDLCNVPHLLRVSALWLRW